MPLISIMRDSRFSDLHRRNRFGVIVEVCSSGERMWGILIYTIRECELL